MSTEYIRDYHRAIEHLRTVSGSDNESVLRGAFQSCLEKYCAQRGLTLVPELNYNDSRPDGTVRDSFRLAWGYWEAKDSKDDLDREINKKQKRGYPTSNIIYENSLTAVLIQDGEEVMRVSMDDEEKLDYLIGVFLDYAPPEVAQFRQAIAQFKQDMPEVLKALRGVIDRAYNADAEFAAAARDFLALCHKAINPVVEKADVREMLIQHILTKDIFLKVFDEDQFHKENNIANRLDDLENTFFTGATRRDTVDRLKSYYAAIHAAAARIDSHFEKQKFLKLIYEEFYKIYNPKAADRLGVVYTPNEIVDFIIKSSDALVRKHFGRNLYHKNVQILDPAAGTGTFITDLIEFIPKAHLAYKYENEIHANEVGILPYYIANLNIEYTYKQKTGTYKEFPNICFVDTLDNLGFRCAKGQKDFIGAMSYENLERVKRQNEKDISVIIGNPPYNANQRNENDNNKNREYPQVDARIKQTYVKQSTAQKTKQYDMYKRFIRWASDRLDKNGVLAFITNSAYIDSRQDDGFRKIVSKEFNEVYIVDLGGDIRTTPGVGNVFGIMTGVAIGLFVRNENKKGCKIYYTKPDDYKSTADKLAFLSTTSFSEINFQHVIPDAKGNWISQTDNDFDELLCVADEKLKLAKYENKTTRNAVFKLFSMGVSTNRDEWVYDFDKKKLRNKTRFFSDTYNNFIKTGDTSFNTIIKWSSTLKNYLKKHKEIKHKTTPIVNSMYRPFVIKYYFANFLMSDRLTQNHCAIFGKTLTKQNKVICFNVNHTEFHVLACAALPDLHFTGDTQCLPLYRYDKAGSRHDNITDWGIKTFRQHYGNEKITAEDIFHYTYAVLHNPAYLKKYAVNLKQEFPRLPFYDDFPAWVRRGKALLNLHINFEKQKMYPIKRIDTDADAGDAKLKSNAADRTITIDEKTKLTEIPPQAWAYKLGSRCAIDWVCDQYKPKTPKDPTIAKKFNNYNFADHKEEVIKLLAKICTVSVETIKIIEEMES